MFIKSLLTSIVVSSIVSSIIIFTFLKVFSSDKIGFVRSGEILKSYKGLAIAQKQFELEYKIAKGNSDTLLKRFDLAKNNLVLKKKSPSDWKKQLQFAENNFLQYQKSADDQLKARQAELSSNAITKINFFIEDYGKSHDYKYILGSTDNGNILYGKVSDDITKEILDGLNNSIPDKDLTPVK